MTIKGRELERLDRNNEIWAMRISNYTLSEIGEHFGITEQRVHQIIKERLAAMPINNIDEWRMVQVSQIEVGMRSLWDRYLMGDHQAVKCMISLFRERAKLLGLYTIDMNLNIFNGISQDWDAVFDKIEKRGSNG